MYHLGREYGDRQIWALSNNEDLIDHGFKYFLDLLLVSIKFQNNHDGQREPEINLVGSLEVRWARNLGLSLSAS